MNFVGRSVTRLEDRPLVTGNGRFAADVSFAHQLHMRVVRSPHAHAGIRAIDTAAARNVPGVVAVWTTADVADIPPIDFRLTRIEGLDPYRQPILATDRVRYVGEPVAAVFATDPYTAEDAADLVNIEAEPLTALMDADAPPGAFDAGHATEVALVRKSFGDVETAFAGAHAVVALDLHLLPGHGLVGLDDINEQVVLPMPHRRGRDGQNAGADADQQPRVDELARP